MLQTGMENISPLCCFTSYGTREKEETGQEEVWGSGRGSPAPMQQSFAAVYLPIASMFLAVGALHHGPLGAFRNFTLISLLVYPQTGHCVLPR